MSWLPKVCCSGRRAALAAVGVDAGESVESREECRPTTAVRTVNDELGVTIAEFPRTDRRAAHGQAAFGLGDHLVRHSLPRACRTVRVASLLAGDRTGAEVDLSSQASPCWRMNLSWPYEHCTPLLTMAKPASHSEEWL